MPQHAQPPLSTPEPSHPGRPQVNIYCDCPLWPDDSMCSMRACSVCECEEGEVPKPWLAAERGLAQTPAHGASCHGAAAPDCNTADCAIEMESQVDQRLEPGMKSKLKHQKAGGWVGGGLAGSRTLRLRARARARARLGARRAAVPIPRHPRAARSQHAHANVVNAGLARHQQPLDGSGGGGRGVSVHQPPEQPGALHGVQGVSKGMLCMPSFGGGGMQRPRREGRARAPTPPPHTHRASTRTAFGLPSTKPSTAPRARRASARRRACSSASSAACTRALVRTCRRTGS